MVKNTFHSDPPNINPGLWSIAICSECQQSHYRCHFEFEIAGTSMTLTRELCPGILSLFHVPVQYITRKYRED